ncbi:MAG: Zn-dependent alcohol dehydrogenase [Rhodobacteraceae bacterium]|nr:Zn-dependent alcohol dehydrogenase [Paracoccaceae bacterium]
MALIKAAVCHEFGAPLVIEEIELRAPVGAEVEVNLDAVAICHSDISYAEGAWGGTLPAVYGHEAAGRITALGAGVRGLKEGDPVVVTLIRACGSCVPCATGSPVTCTTPHDGDKDPISTTSGGLLHQAMACGAFAERVVVDHSQVVKLPEGMAMDAASMLACGVITGIGAVVNSAGLRAGQNAVIIGAGGVGLNAIQGARIAGAANIIAVDMNQDKLDAAMEFGATHGVLANEGAPWRQVRKITGGQMADAVFVTVGAIPAYEAAPRYLARNGRVIMVGMPHTGATASYEPVMMAAVSQGLIGTKMGDVVIARDIPWMVDLYQQGRLKLDELISRRWSLDEINEAIADTKAGHARRNVIVFR